MKKYHVDEETFKRIELLSVSMTNNAAVCEHLNNFAWHTLLLECEARPALEIAALLEMFQQKLEKDHVELEEIILQLMKSAHTERR